MTVKLLIERDLFETRSVLISDDTLIDFDLSPHHLKSNVGEIHFARITRFSDNMEAAFVELADKKQGLLLTRNCPALSDAPKDTPIRQKINEGQRLLVQIIKDGKDEKALEVSAIPIIDGQLLSYKPSNNGVQFPKGKLDGKARSFLQRNLEPIEGRFIIRSRADDALEGRIYHEGKSLAELWQNILKHVQSLSKPTLMHQPLPRLLSAAMDLQALPIEIHCNDPQIKALVRSAKLEGMCRYFHWANPEPLFSAHHVNYDIAELSEKRLTLPGGGNITIEQTEALVAIDVNAGSSGDANNPSAHGAAVNLQAASLIAAQIRLRNLSGIIIIDFIQMNGKNETTALIDTLKQLTAADPCTVRVLSMTELGLLQITRKRTTPPLNQIRQSDLRCGLENIRLDQASDIVRQIRAFCLSEKSAVLSLAIAEDLEPFFTEHKSAIENELGITLNWQQDSNFNAGTFKISIAHR